MKWLEWDGHGVIGVWVLVLVPVCEGVLLESLSEDESTFEPAIKIALVSEGVGERKLNDCATVVLGIIER